MNGHTCWRCGKEFTTNFNLQRHLKSHEVHSCEKCGKIYARPTMLERHRRQCDGENVQNPPPQPDASRKRLATPPEQTCQPANPGPPSKRARLNTQHGAGADETQSASSSDTQEVVEPIRRQEVEGETERDHTPHADASEMLDPTNTPRVIRRARTTLTAFADDKTTPYEDEEVLGSLEIEVGHYWGSIASYMRTGRVEDILNVRLWDPQNDNFEPNLWNRLRDAWKTFRTKAKANASVGCLLEHKHTGEIRYFHSSSNNATLFENPRLISSEADLDAFVDDITSTDLQHESVRKRPNTEWKLYAVTNITFYFYKLQSMSRVGRPHRRDDIPDWITSKQSIFVLDRNPRTGEYYDDNLCFFRCLAVKQACSCSGTCRCSRVSERRAKDLRDVYLASCGSSLESFPGVSESDLLGLESLFQTRIMVFSLKEDGMSDVEWCSKRVFPKTLNLNLYGDHFSYIRDLDLFCRSYTCPTCSTCYDRAFNFARHVCPVEKASEFVFPGGAFQTPENIFVRLKRDVGIEVTDELRFYPFMIAYDIEAMLPQNNLPANTPSMQYENRHEFLSVSVCSNVPGFTDAVCFVRRSSVSECLDRFVDHLQLVADQAKELMTKRFEKVLAKLTKKIDKMEKKEKPFAACKFSSPRAYKKRDRLSGIEQDLMNYLSVIPVLGFNSQRYDLNIIKGRLIQSLLASEDKLNFVVKKLEAMCCIQTSSFKFLDITNFIAPGYSYAMYLRAFGASQPKGVFPYEWMDSLDKLRVKQLPAKECFYSRLNRKHITDEDYATVQRAWRDNNMNSVKDLLVWYNNLDVAPFLEAVRNQSEVYRERGIDMLKEAISLPGLAVVWLFSVIGSPTSLKTAYNNSSGSHWRRISEAVLKTRSVHLVDQDNADVYNLLRKNTVGGPSIVFHRYHEAGKTFIKPELYGADAKLCRSIFGVDANALYLYCVQKDMPVGMLRRRWAEDNFAIERKQKTGKTAQGWLGWTEFQTGNRLETACNGGERRLGRHGLPVDGYDNSTQTVYQFHGCFWHGHTCDGANQRDLGGRSGSTRLKETKDKEAYLRGLGYKVVVMWECDWRKTVESSTDIKQFLRAFFKTMFGEDRGMSQSDILRKVCAGTLFGFVECDIAVPEQLRHVFAEMPPIFKNVELSREDLSAHMRQFAEEHDHLARPQRSLIGSMLGKRIVLFTELLKWYLDHGLVVSKIYQVLEYERSPIFEQFGDSVSNARREGDADPSKELLASTAKLIGNSLYGKTITDKSRHRNVNYYEDDHKASVAVRSNLFHSVNELDGGVFETTSYKKKIKMDVPVTIGFTILQRAKLRMLEYNYDFVARFVDDKDYQQVNTDTDSGYKCLSGTDILRVVRPECLPDVKSEHEQWFVTDYCPVHKEAYFSCVLADREWKPELCCRKARLFDSRTPGKFKVEFTGSGIVALNAKTYACVKDETELNKMFPPGVDEAPSCTAKRLTAREKAGQKLSSKGLSKKTNRLTFDQFKQVLFTRAPVTGINTGFIKKNNTTYTYSQRKTGLTYFYSKRKVLSNGVSTEPLDI